MTKLWAIGLLVVLLLLSTSVHGQVAERPTLGEPLVIVAETKEVRVAGLIYPTRFNAAQGEEAHYHLLVWQGGKSTNALIETPADDLAFHDALLGLGGQPGDNLTMAAWRERHEAHSTAPLENVTGSALDVRVSWEGNATGIPIDQVFRHPGLQTMDSGFHWRFGGNRARWFNRVPLAPRPGCLACLYSCPSGKVSNGALSIHDYVTAPSRFYADTDILPPDGTLVIVTFRLLP